MSQENPEHGVSRRNLFKIGGGVLAATILGSATYKYLHQGAAIQLDKLGIKLPKAINPLPAPPADPALNVEKLSTLFTPNDKFFIIDNAVVVPEPSCEVRSTSIRDESSDLLGTMKTSS